MKGERPYFRSFYLEVSVKHARYTHANYATATLEPDEEKHTCNAEREMPQTGWTHDWVMDRLAETVQSSYTKFLTAGSDEVWLLKKHVHFVPHMKSSLCRH
jgi:hypothetical protein